MCSKVTRQACLSSHMPHHKNVNEVANQHICFSLPVLCPAQAGLL
jgi:hypothetical protein